MRVLFVEHMFDRVGSGGSALRPVAAGDCEVFGSGVPAGLDEMTPGPERGVVLSGLEVDALCGHDRVVVLEACLRMASHC